MVRAASCSVVVLKEEWKCKCVEEMLFQCSSDRVLFPGVEGETPGDAEACLGTPAAWMFSQGACTAGL